MRTSVVVVPRERFTSLAVSLRSLFATVPESLPVVVAEGASPRFVREELWALQDERPFELVSLPYMVKPNEARNIGVARCSTDYVVIADNDIHYEPGWLEALVRHADEHESDAVAPLICIGPPAATIIHHAGGLLSAERANGRFTLHEHHRLMDVPLAEAEVLPEVDNHVCEFHCMLLRRSLLERMGGLDERLVTREQIDFALRTFALGGRTTFARDAVVTYMARDSFEAVDLRYHLFRWADRFVVESLDALESTWEIAVDRDMYRYSWAAAHRARAAETTYPRLRKLLGPARFRRFVVARLEAKVVAEQERARAGVTVSVPAPLPPERVADVLDHLAAPADLTR